MQKLFKLSLVGAIAVGLSGCGDTVGEQALIGAGAGVGVAAVTGTSLAAGAAVGVAANVVYCQQYPSRC